MGLLDKVKAAAQDVGAAAKKGTAQLQEKVEQSQTRKKADEAARQLGYLIVRERTEGVPAGEEADRLVSEVVALQAQIDRAMEEGSSEAASTPEGQEPRGEEPPAPPTSASEPAAGDFKLD